jgi:peptide/nickel transport system permease protein
MTDNTVVLSSPIKRRATFKQRITRIAVLYPGLLAGLVIIVLFIFTAILAESLAPYDPLELFRDRTKSAPSAEHIFGTDNLGRDILSRVIFGSRISLTVGLVAVAIALVCGTFFGVIAGFYGGIIDSAIMRITDIMLAFPGTLLAISIIAILGPSLENVMIAVGISTIPVYTRTARGSVLKVKSNEYIEAARCVGVKNALIMYRHILPNMIAPIIVISTVNVGTAILSAAGLSFLGLGAQPPTPEWGAMLSEARTFLRQCWWMATFPGLAIMLVVLSVNLIGDALREILDPSMRREV